MVRPSLLVRPLDQGEMEFLAHLRKSRRQAVRQRAQILLASVVYTSRVAAGAGGLPRGRRGGGRPAPT